MSTDPQSDALFQLEETLLKSLRAGFVSGAGDTKSALILGQTEWLVALLRSGHKLPDEVRNDLADWIEGNLPKEKALTLLKRRQKANRETAIVGGIVEY